MQNKSKKFFTECEELNLDLWQCPPFLFVVMGFITIVSMIATYLLASRAVAEPELAALIVIVVAVLLLVVGNLIIAAFKKIADANRMKSEFISIASHQLRTPLSVLKWTCEVAEKDFQKNGQVRKTVIDTFRQHTERMIGIINSLLDVSRIEAGTLVLKKEEVSLPALASFVIHDLEQYARASNITLALHTDEKMPLAFGDRDRILALFQNLIDNAIRYSKGAGLVDIYIETKGTMLEVRVRDRGIGIPENQKKLIFQKFYRSPSGARFQTSGTGIGLYISKNIVEELGGKIGFTSNIGEGSTFWFTLPIKTNT